MRPAGSQTAGDASGPQRLLAGLMAPSTPQPVRPICAGRLPICDTQPRLPEAGQPAVQPHSASLVAVSSLPKQPLPFWALYHSAAGHPGSPCSCCLAYDPMPDVWQLRHAWTGAHSCQQCVPEEILPAQPGASAICISLLLFFSSMTSS